MEDRMRRAAVKMTTTGLMGLLVGASVIGPASPAGAGDTASATTAVACAASDAATADQSVAACWHYIGGYANLLTCRANGIALVQTGGYSQYSCVWNPSGFWELWVSP
jgi:hypothetical protein